jgi:hypothetical protein
MHRWECTADHLRWALGMEYTTTVKCSIQSNLTPACKTPQKLDVGAQSRVFSRLQAENLARLTSL